MANFKLFIDAEADFYYNIPSPHFSKIDMVKWKLNKLRGKAYRYPNPSRKGIENIIKILNKYKFPATFCFCGHLYLKECSGWQHFDEIKPQANWYKNKIGKDWYYWDKGGNFKTKPGLYMGDLIEDISSNENFEFGLHSFTHEALTLESKETVDSIINAGMKAAKERGIIPTSFGAPFEMISDTRDPNKVFDVLRKYKLKNVQFSGQDTNLTIHRKFDITKIKKENNLNIHWISNYLEGTDPNKKIKTIIKGIKSTTKTDKTYILATHDFTWKNTKKLELLIKKIQSLQR